MVRRIGFLVVLMTLTALLAACIQPIADPDAAGAATTADAAGAVVRIGWDGTIDTLNPVASQSLATSLVTRLLYDTMVRLQLDGTYAPAAAESMEVSEDGKTWTFTLREGQTFADGEPLTAEDVVFSYTLFKNTPESFASTAAEFFETIEAPDGRTVVITLSEAIPNMESQLITLTILPEHIWRDHVDDPMAFANAAAVGSGPFRLADYGEEAIIRLAANPDHPLHGPQIDGVDFIFYPDGTEIEALKDGEVDLIWVAAESMGELEEAENVAVVTGAPYDPTLTDIILNVTTAESCPPEDGVCSGHPALLDRNVRLALAHATDKQGIIDETLNGLGTPGLMLVPDGLGHWYNDTIEDYAFDIATANQILDDAGYLDSDGDGVREMPDGSRPLLFRLNWEEGGTESDLIADILADMWAEIGVRLEPAALDFDTLLGVCCPSFDYDIIIWGWGSDPDPSFMLSILTTEAIAYGLNETGYANPEYDALYAEQSVTLDEDARREIVWRMQEIAHADIPYIVPYYLQNVQAYRTDRFQGWVTDEARLELADISSLSQVEPVKN